MLNRETILIYNPPINKLLLPFAVVTVTPYVRLDFNRLTSDFASITWDTVVLSTITVFSHYPTPPFNCFLIYLSYTFRRIYFLIVKSNNI